MKKRLLTFALILLGFQGLRADEGMWLPMFIQRLNYVDMQKMGLQLSAEEIYSINNSSLKDAIIQFGGGCTGEIVSQDGLLFTNHHCGYGQIQYHSTVEHDYLKDGFWAKSKSEELACPGLTAKFLVRMDDVSARVLAKTNTSMTEVERAKAVREEMTAIEKEMSENGKYTVNVKEFFNGNEYYVFIYEIYNDVRMVGAPPSSIGKFGADTDNWMWPRHTADFAIFRVYMSKDGKPADYSADNVPLKPKHYLPISMEGVKEGDFAMIMGYPGSTDRFLTSFGVEQNIAVKDPAIINIRQNKLEVMDKYMNADQAVRIQYASKRAGTANYWKYFIGQDKQLQKNHVADKKREVEKQYTQWASDKSEYKNALTDIQQATEAMGKYEVMNWYVREAIMRGPDALPFAYRFSTLNKELTKENPNQDAVKNAAGKINADLDNYFKDYYLPLDQDLTAKMFELYSKNVPEDQQPKEFVELVKKNKGDFAKMTKDMFAKSIMVDKDKVGKFLANPDAKVLAKDPVFTMTTAIFDGYNAQMKATWEDRDKLTKATRLYVDGVRKMQSDKKFAPNANSTMRMTYGQVLPYSPADAVMYDYKTTIKGVMQKDNPKVDEFAVPQRLKDLYNAKDFGAYAEDGTLVTCFIANTDITGGNSGSPVINNKGELIGIAFDGDWEAMSGDIFFEKDLQRTIAVDVRYVLFIIDKYAGAKNLIEELSLR